MSAMESIVPYTYMLEEFVMSDWRRTIGNTIIGELT